MRFDNVFVFMKGFGNLFRGGDQWKWKDALQMIGGVSLCAFFFLRWTIVNQSIGDDPDDPPGTGHQLGDYGISENTSSTGLLTK